MDGTIAEASILEAMVDRDLTLRFVEIATHASLRVPTWFFEMVGTETGEALGSINLRTVSSVEIVQFSGHIGYGVLPEHRGHGFAARAVRLLLPLARHLAIEPLWITCDPENTASRRSCERAGAELVEIVDLPITHTIHWLGHTRKCRYRLRP